MRFLTLLIISAFLIFFSSCKTSEYAYATRGESVKLKVDERSDAINYLAIKEQKILSLQERSGRGAFTPLAGTAISLATDMVKKMIANERKKYIADYSLSVSDLYFYDQLSTESCFDPVGMQFSGFTVVRTFMNKENKLDTALVAKFELDTSKQNEIINNSIFRLKLQDLDLRYTKAKMTSAQKDRINVDMEITFMSSYVNEMGQLFNNMELGKFYLIVRGAPLNRNNSEYAAYYSKLKNRPLVGKSFIVPRSFGYYKTVDGQVEKSYSQGGYSIVVKVKESTKDKFVTTVLVDNSNTLINFLSDKAKGVVTPPAKGKH
jgi:hypothetical protein